MAELEKAQLGGVKKVVQKIKKKLKPKPKAKVKVIKPKVKVTKTSGKKPPKSKPSKPKKTEITKAAAAKRLGSGAWEGGKWVAKRILPILGIKEIADMTGLTNVIFPKGVPENFKDYKTSTGDLPGGDTRANPNMKKSKKYPYGGSTNNINNMRTVNRKGITVPGMYQDGGDTKEGSKLEKYQLGHDVKNRRSKRETASDRKVQQIKDRANDPFLHAMDSLRQEKFRTREINDSLLREEKRMSVIKAIDKQKSLQDSLRTKKRKPFPKR
jgi:hypothetical protein